MKRSNIEDPPHNILRIWSISEESEFVKLQYGLNYYIGGDGGSKPAESKESDAINSTDHKRDEEGSMLGHKVPTTTTTGTTTNIYLVADVFVFVIHLLCFWVRWWVRHFWLPSGVPHIPVLPPHSQRTVTLSSTSPANDGWWRSPGNIAVVLAVVLVVELVLVLFMSEKRGKKEQVWSPPSSAGLGGWS